MTQQRRDRRVLRAAADLEAVAANVAKARGLIFADLRATNGEIGAPAWNVGGRSADLTTSVERTVLARFNLDAELLVGDVDVDEIVRRVRRLEGWCARAISTRVPKLDVPRCHSDKELAGYLEPLAEGGWFDPLCTNVPRYKAGQCDACRKRLERWRAKHERSALADERGVEFESKVAVGELGVVHAKPKTVVA